MKFVIGLILLISSVSGQDKVAFPYYVNVINADKNPPDRICGGVLVNDTWALSCMSCVESLFKISQNVIITAGHSEDKEPDQTIKVTMVPVGKEVNGQSLVALHLAKPVTKNPLVKWAKLPQSDFTLCKAPQSFEFQPTALNGTSSSGARIIGFLLGVILADEIKKIFRRHRRGSEQESSKDSLPYGAMAIGSDEVIAVTTLRDVCTSCAGWPLMCGRTVVGVEINCKREGTKENEVKSEFINLRGQIDDIERIMLGKVSNAAENIAPPVIHAEKKHPIAAPAMSRASYSYGGVWRKVVLFAVATCLFFARLL